MSRHEPAEALADRKRTNNTNHWSGGPTTATTGYVLGAAGAVPGLRPGEGDMGEGLPHAWGVTGGPTPRGEMLCYRKGREQP
jgi:hypothetical protein